MPFKKKMNNCCFVRFESVKFEVKPYCRYVALVQHIRLLACITMREPIIIFILLFLTLFQSYGQTLETKDVYKLKSRQYTWLPDSTVYMDSIDLNPFKLEENINQITIFVDGLEQRYRLDIKLTSSDTTAYITAYTYEVKPSKPSKEEKRMFPNYKIDKKEEWKLKSKLTAVTDTIINSVLTIIETVDFDSLPSYEKMRDDIGLIQCDGHGFGFAIRNENYIVKYYVNSLYLNKHEKLNDLHPIESLLLDFLKNRNNLKVKYLNDACYNGGSAMWICR